MADSSNPATPPPQLPPEATESLRPADLRPVACPRRLRRWVARRVLRAFTLCYPLLCALASVLGRIRGQKPVPPEGIDILVTGTFYSDNWLLAHLRPLAGSSFCRHLCVVSTYPIPPIPNLTAIYPPTWLTRVTGQVGGRLLTFAWLAWRRRPHLIGGFHLLINGLVAALVARLARTKAMYFCVGGPMEVVDGGIWAENRIFGRLEVPDKIIERRLIRTVGFFDLVVTMGTRAITFYRQHGIQTRFQVISGGMNPDLFHPSEAKAEFDLILVGRLAEIKRIDVFLQAIALVSRSYPQVTAAIIGDGPQLEPLKRLATELGIAGNVRFEGHQSNVADWLRKARLFVLTSDTEGLALSLMEAMSCGLPAVVSNVGDLADLVEEGVNGHLVPRGDPSLFADRMQDLLQNESRRRAFSERAVQSVQRYRVDRVAELWNDVLRATVDGKSHEQRRSRSDT